MTRSQEVKAVSRGLSFGKPGNAAVLIAAAAIFTLSAEVAVPKEQVKTLPIQTPPVFHSLDKDNLIRFQAGDKIVYNVFSVAAQAVDGTAPIRTLLGPRDLLKDQEKQNALDSLRVQSADVGGAESLDAAIRQAALSWLEDNAVELKPDTLVWYYEFDNAYNDIASKAPWPSAFGQAYVIQALLKAYRDTGDEKYKSMAVKAARLYAVDVSDGGVRSYLNGEVFFEEIPHSPAPHILNGHMISVVTLIEAGRQLGVKEIEDLGLEGAATLRNQLHRFDLGYWSRYDLNMRKFEIPLRIVPMDAQSAAGFMVDRVEVVEPASGGSSVLDIGSEADTNGPLRVAGTDWKAPSLYDNETVRAMKFGPDRRSSGGKKGSIQNTYLYVEIPTQEFAEYSGDEVWNLKIRFFDAAPSRVMLQSQIANQGGFVSFQTLPNGLITTTGKKEWRTAYATLGSKQLAWFVGKDYQIYHVKLLRQLFELTGETIFKVYGDRWQEYIDWHDDGNPESIPRADSRGWFSFLWPTATHIPPTPNGAEE